jgi:hypothetical protein
VLDEWRSEDEARAIAVPARLDLTLDGRIAELAFGALEMTNARGAAHIAPTPLPKSILLTITPSLTLTEFSSSSVRMTIMHSPAPLN